MDKKKKIADIKTHAEFIITVTWDKKSADDVDTWLQDPTGGILYYENKEMNLSHLDRDDIGKAKDEITLPNGEIVVIEINQEMTTIRGFIAGEWVLNLHMYAKRNKEPATVTVQIDKLNPRAQPIFLKQFIMTQKGEEITVTRFEMTGEGRILGFSDLPKNLVEIEKQPGGM